jgi:serine protease Do
VLAGDRYGAGFVLSESGLALTNQHVVGSASRVSILLWGDELTHAEVLDTDPQLDLALLRIEGEVVDTAELGTMRDVRVGDEVLAIGSPLKMFFSVSRGTVSFVNRSLERVQFLQTDLPINSGNSGGPLVDADGRVIGVVSFILRDSQGISFSLPIDRALERFEKYLSPPADVAPVP